MEEIEEEIIDKFPGLGEAEAVLANRLRRGAPGYAMEGPWADVLKAAGVEIGRGADEVEIFDRLSDVALDVSSAVARSYSEPATVAAFRACGETFRWAADMVRAARESQSAPQDNTIS